MCFINNYKTKNEPNLKSVKSLSYSLIYIYICKLYICIYLFIHILSYIFFIYTYSFTYININIHTQIHIYGTYFRKLEIVNSFSVSFGCKSPSLLQFSNSGMSFLRTWELFLWNVIIEEVSVPIPQFLWENRSLTWINSS